MKYNQPYASSDPDAPYVDHNTANAVAGSVPPAAAIEHPQREIVAVIKSAFLTPDSNDPEQMLKALQVYFSRPRIYPECLGAGGRFGVYAPAAGTVRLPGGVTFLIRGLTRYTTVQTDFATAASKTYHLRWDKDNGYRLLPMSSSTYNPASLAEDDASFDSTYDDMLIARVVTNGANVATITDLRNRDRLTDNATILGMDINLGGANGANYTVDRTLNWARTPSTYTLNWARVSYSSGADSDINFTDRSQNRAFLTTAPTSIPVNRYGLSCYAMWDFSVSATLAFTARD